MNYAQTIEYLFQRLPMFTRVGSVALKPGLQNIIHFCNHLDNPQDQFKTIHIGGTNGKGSTSHMLAAILQKAGYKTGLYTSPHLKDFRERIRINGKMVPKKFVVNFVKNQKKHIESLDTSFFEVTVAMAFEFFKEENVDVAIIEVGLGGRLDSTNIINPDLSVITNISLDHTNILGNTKSAIATEKAGIIKYKTPIIIGEFDPEITGVFQEKATEMQAEISYATPQFSATDFSRTDTNATINIFQNHQLLFKNLALDLPGSYQAKNVLGVIAAVSKLNMLGYKITNNQIRSALKQVKKLTGLQGRWQTLSENPLVICDTGHNEAGILEVLESIKNTKFENLHFVMGVLKDKEVKNVLSLLPTYATYYFCAPKLERALPAFILQEEAKKFHLNGNIYSSVEEAILNAKKQASKNDLIFIGGSTFVVSEVL